MQVKKFESRSMKEAINLVKSQLGPDAIILSIKERKRGFGLAGETSFEVTAAVSEMTLRKKQMAETKLTQKNKTRYNQVSARVQKEFIDKSYLKNFPKIEEAEEVQEVYVAPVTHKETRYIDIHDSAEDTARAKAKNAADVAASVRENSQINLLQKEILQLRGLIAEFQRVPQTFASSYPGANDGIPYELSFIFDKLLKAGVSTECASEMLRKAQKNLSTDQLKRPAMVEAWVARFIMEVVQITSKEQQRRYQVFVGPSGNGKTSMMVKTASQLVIMEKKKVGIVTADTGKVGAVDQLKIFAKILNIPLAVLTQPGDWERINRQFANCDYILVDYAGTSLKSADDLLALTRLLPSREERTVHLVVSTASKDADVMEIAGRYRSVNFDDFIFTKLDESGHHGLILNLERKFKCPVHSFGTGPQIPEDFEMATKERVVDLIFKLTKIQRERG